MAAVALKLSTIENKTMKDFNNTVLRYFPCVVIHTEI